MISSLETKKAQTISTEIFTEFFKNIICELGFPLAVAVFLIYISWQMQGVLIAADVKHDREIGAISQALRRLESEIDKSTMPTPEKNLIREKLKTGAFAQEKRQGQANNENSGGKNKKNKLYTPDILRFK